MALETGTHSPWVSRLLTQLGHEVIVAHARNVRLIGESSRKDDRLDARTLARLARIDPGLLGPVRHRSAEAQIHLTVIRARAALVGTRTALVNAARGLTKSYGERLKKCGTEQMNRDSSPGAEPGVARGLGTAVAGDRIVERADRGIRSADRANRQGSAPRSGPAETSQRCGDTDRVDLRSDSGRSTPISPQPGCGMFSRIASRAQELRAEQPQLHISKEGDRYLRTLMVQGAHYILGPFGQDSDLRRWGLKLAERGGKNAKKRAVVAVARKLAVLLHKLWVSGEVYEPLRNNHKVASAVA